MNSLLKVSALLVLLSLVGCNKGNELLTMNKEVTPKITEAFNLLKSITDVEKAKAAKPKIIELTKYFEEVTKRIAAIKGIEQKKTDELKASMKEMMKEFLKVQEEYHRLVLIEDKYLEVIGKEVEKLYLAIKK